MDEEMKLYILNKFTYDQVTGEFINNSTGRQNAPSAGGRYIQAVYRGKQIYVHKFIWMMFNNWREPVGIIDHINGNTLDNRIENLREVTHTENMINRSNASVYGKWISKSGKRWRITFVFKGVEQFYSFNSLVEAEEFRTLVDKQIQEGVYKLKRPDKSKLPIGIYKKRSKTQKEPYLVSLDGVEERSFATLEEAVAYLNKKAT